MKHDPADDHRAVFDEATGLFIARSTAYGDVYKNYGALANLLNGARKIDRTMEAWWQATTVPVMHKDALDDAFDALNYLNFFIREARAGNITGHTPERPDDHLKHLKPADFIARPGGFDAT